MPFPRLLSFLSTFILVVFALLFSPNHPAYASEQFETSFSSQYRISPDGSTNVFQNITLKNRYSNIFATEYSLEVGSNNLDNIQALTKSGEPIPISTTTTDNSTAITVNFQNQVVGKGQEQAFIITYINPDVAQINGQVLETYIPKISNLDQIEHLQVQLLVPQEFGLPSLASPSVFITETDGLFNKITFQKKDLQNKGITVVFGDSQHYSLTLNYHLQNPSSTNGITQISLPPDTPYQRVYLHTFDPPPTSIKNDKDGNWLATYTLSPKQKLDIVLQADVTVFIEPKNSIPNYTKDLNQYLKPLPYWQADDPTIKALAKDLDTPEKIYHFLVKNFTYNYSRLDNSSSQRLGAVQALKTPNNVICQEFTDTFIALARAAGIPAREHNGYAFTQNDRLRPLSLIQDVLHSWPEYYDHQTKQWVPIDPTWANTTGGVDYFNALDLNHITFAIHGLDSSKPYPVGYYKLQDTNTKDISVELGIDKPHEKLDFGFDLTLIPTNLFGFTPPASLALTNNSNVALYNQTITITSPDFIAIKPHQHQLTTLLPLSQTHLNTTLTPKTLFHTKPSTLVITIKDQTFTYDLQPIRHIPVWFSATIFLSLGAIFLFLAIITWRLLVSRRRR